MSLFIVIVALIPQHISRERERDSLPSTAAIRLLSSIFIVESHRVTMTSPKQFNISQLPSLVKDGMSVSEEAIKRRKTCRFIEESGRILKLPRVAIATAMVFFHRFYAKHAFSDHDRFEVAVASIILAAKTEESPKKVNLVIEECYKLKMRGMQAGRISVGNATSIVGDPTSTAESLDPQSDEFNKLKERILLLERVLLHTIGFELSIDHPYKFLVDQIKKLVHGRKVEYIPGSSIAQETEKLSSAQIRDKMMNQIVQWCVFSC
jgi:Cyclin, N-terminal domain